MTNTLGILQGLRNLYSNGLTQTAQPTNDMMFGLPPLKPQLTEDTLQLAKSNGEYFSSNPVDQNKLDQMLKNIAEKSPVGKRLLEECQKNGVKFVAKPNDQDGIPAQFDPNSNTIYVETDDIALLTHEMLHGATPENINSKQEELRAFQIGEIVKKQVDPSHEMLDSAFLFNHVNKEYPELSDDNGIDPLLSELLQGYEGQLSPGGSVAGQPVTAQQTTPPSQRPQQTSPVQGQPSPAGSMDAFMQQLVQLSQQVAQIQQYCMAMLAKNSPTA